MGNYSDKHIQQQIEKTPFDPPQHIEEVPSAKGIELGPIKIHYGNLKTDLIAGCIVLVLVAVGYIIKKKIDAKYRNKK